jgi:Soluble lytic murein transglycosylase and related regulatory proteins (some contain LysM/invasin domains)
MRCAAVFLLTGMSFVCVPVVSVHAQTLTIPAQTVPERYVNYVSEAASRFDIPALWIDAVMQAESFGDTAATSPKGAMGLMQIMPATWAELRGRYGLGANPYDPHDNILAGAAYLRELYDRYGPDGFLAAYNAGPGRYERFLETGRALPSETQTYIAQVIRRIGLNASGGRVQEASFFPSRVNSASFAASKGDGRTVASAAIPVQDLHTVSARDPQPRFALAPQSTGLFVPLSRQGAQP